jgi:hypothetical protein
MRKPLFLLTAAALVAGAALTGSAVAQDRSRRAELTANQIADQVEARTARIRADLRLTPEQENFALVLLQNRCLGIVCRILDRICALVNQAFPRVIRFGKIGVALRT